MSNSHTNFLECILPEYGIKMDYPSEWIKVDNNAVLHNNIIVGFGRRGDDAFLESLTIYLLDLPPTTFSLKEIVDKNMLHLKNENPTFELLELYPTTISGLPAYRILYTITKYKTLNIFTIKGDKVYMLIYDSKLDTYQEYLSTIEKMIGSFEFLS